jgi:HD-GYP domain-containing protein (c-di-GMP phosphodiesterase class II)
MLNVRKISPMELMQKFIAIMNTSISNYLLYSGAHETVEQSADKVFSILNEMNGQGLDMMIIGEELVINRIPAGDSGLKGDSLVSRLKKRGVTRVEFLSGVTATEIKEFITNISRTDSDLRSSPHVKVGITGIRTLNPDVDCGIELDDLPEDNSEQPDTSGDDLDISHFRRLETVGLEDIVINFISTFRKESNLLKLVSPVKTHSEYTYTHATNVSVLSMFQAESLGIKGKLLHDIGIAALLHDVGKLFISNEILNKKGALDDSESSEMSRHTILGAQYLITVEGLTRLAPIVALEHHRKYNGTGYPATNGNGRAQHICSQIVAISDFFDAMRSWRPYRKSWQAKDIINIMKKHTSTDFNPFLLDNFIRMLHTALSQ